MKSKLFYLFYLFVGIVLYIAALPILLLLSLKQKYKQSIPARFFLRNNPPLEKSSVWFHACSLGEVASLKPLLESFDDVAVTTTTQTGFAQAQKMTPNSRYLPFEILLAFWMPKSKVLVVLEAELWYLLFVNAKKRGMKTMLLSARISDRSYKSYMKMRFLYRRVLENIDIIYAQSDKDRLRLLELGATNVEVAGNIKFANTPQVTHRYAKPKGVLLITAASTHEGEEEMVLKAFKKANLHNAKLLLVPRHPERFEAVAQLLESKSANKTFHRFSQQRDFHSDIVLVDMMGELNNLYAITDVTILCGSFAKIGGHNPIEPAYFSNKIISGEHFFNQQATYKHIQNICITQDLTKSLQQHEKIEKAVIDTQKFDLQRVKKRIEDASI
ncbi:MAG: lipid IV(A) 3-deoxy-D-manno-octulosonic acid transferase [Campylobacterota bacterium]